MLVSRRAPILDLPFELLSKIFVFCLPLHRRIQPSPQKAPLLLAQICAHWRAVALSTPELWCSILFRFPFENAYDGVPTLFGAPEAEYAVFVACQPAATLDLWLTRAASHPVSVSIFRYDSNTNFPPDVLRVLGAHCAHWGRIELQITDEEAPFWESLAAAGSFPLLMSLTVRTPDGSTPPSVAKIIRDSPNLIALDIPTVAGLDLQAMPPRLAALHIEGLGLVDFRDISLACPNLRHFWPPEYIYLSLSDSASMLPLESLVLRNRVTLPLDTLRIPTLRLLEAIIDSPESLSHLSSFLSRSSCKLVHLTLTVGLVHVEQPELVQLFVSLPTLRTLHLVFELFTSLFDFQSSQLLFLGQHDTVLPRLAALIVTDHSGGGTYAPALAILAAHPTLRRGEIHISPKRPLLGRLGPPKAKIVAQIQALAEAGMDIRVTAPSYRWPPGTEREDDDAPGDLDYLITTTSRTKPYFFSPF